MEIDKQEIMAITEEIRQIEDMVLNLEDAARVDMQPKVDRLKVMEAALLRDVKEMEQETGADRETTEQLYIQLEKEADSLMVEMEALSQGNPTTVAAAADAVFHAVDKLSKMISDKKEEVKAAYREGLESAGKK